MNLFDMIVGDESAQIQASERLTEAVKGYEKAGSSGASPLGFGAEQGNPP